MNVAFKRNEEEGEENINIFNGGNLIRFDGGAAGRAGMRKRMRRRKNFQVGHHLFNNIKKNI